jgi:signal peptidase I
MLTRHAARLALALAAVGALVVAGCGQSSRKSAASSIEGTVSALHTAFAERDAAAACAQLTSAYWQAFRQELTPRLEAFGVSLPGADCVADLQHVFRKQPTNTVAVPDLRVSHVAVHGKTATAALGISGPGSPARFVEDANGRWRLDCCAGSQADRQAAVTYRVSSPAMAPTLTTGQTVTSDNAALRARPPALGDIVAFHPPRTVDEPDRTAAACADRREGPGHPRPCGATADRPSTQVFIKRIVGLAGDHIAIVRGHVVRNGVLEREPFAAACTEGPGGECSFPTAIVVPPDTYYVLGDNRPQSDDSREWGPVRRAWVIGLIRP